MMISACLLGERVRYDGEHKRNQIILDFLADSVNWIPVCPEVHAGFGTPRPPIELIMNENKVEVVEVDTQRPVTTTLRASSRNLLKETLEQGIHGAILKSRSPSCGLGNTPIRTSTEGLQQG